MTMRPFCELLVGGCLEVGYVTRQGETHRMYRTVEGIDLSLLSDEEREVAGRLGSFRSLVDLLEEAGEDLPGARRELVEQCAGILDDALAYCPPVSSC